MAEAHQAGVADEQHHPGAGDGPDEDQRELADVELAHQPRRGQGQDAEQRIPEALAVVPEERHVLGVAGGEDEAHRRTPYTFFACSDAKMPCGRTKSIASRITKALTSPRPGGR